MHGVLRDGVLDGLALAAAHVPAASSAPFEALLARAGALGADVVPVAVDPAGEQPPLPAPARAVAWDGAGAYARAAGGMAGLRATLDGAWLAVRGSAGAWPEGGMLLLLAPPPGDAHAEAARAGLENLARTLSIEWARLAVRPVAICPGTATSPAEVAELACFLLSPAGGYYAGCRFDLR